MGNIQFEVAIKRTIHEPYMDTEQENKMVKQKNIIIIFK